MRNLGLLVIISSFIFACSGTSSDIEVTKNEEIKDTIIDSFEERVAQIEECSALLYADSLTFNATYAENLLNAYDEYIKYHSFEANSKEYQFKAGELAKALNKPHVAIKYFNELLNRDAEHEKAPVALFYKAMIIGDMLHEDKLAIETYKEFIEKYPDHPFKESAEQSIILQGKTLDEIVSEFEKNS